MTGIFSYYQESKSSRIMESFKTMVPQVSVPHMVSLMKNFNNKVVSRLWDVENNFDFLPSSVDVFHSSFSTNALVVVHKFIQQSVSSFAWIYSVWGLIGRGWAQGSNLCPHTTPKQEMYFITRRLIHNEIITNPIYTISLLYN